MEELGYFLLQSTEILAKQLYFNEQDEGRNKVMTQTISHQAYTEVQLKTTIQLHKESFLKLGVNTCSSPN